MAELHPHRIIYSSGLIIPDSAKLATLAVFYDQIALPSLVGSSYIGLEGTGGQRGSYRVVDVDSEISYVGRDGKRYKRNEEFNAWRRKYAELFRAGVITRLPPPKKTDLAGWRWSQLMGAEASTLCPEILSTEGILGSHTGRNVQLLFVHVSQFEHLVRADVSGPSVFVSSSSRSSREIFKAFEAEAAFRILLPRLGTGLAIEEILELRELVSDNREGFAMHLQALSLEVQNAINASAPKEEIARAAKDIVETKLIPDYAEFRRQLEAKNHSFFGKLMEPIGKVLAIDAAPWTPKFWGEFLGALGSAFGLVAAVDSDDLSNRHQAFHLMKVLDDASLN